MELPKIIESILPQKKSSEERVLALVITCDHVKCALLETEKGGAILGSGEEEYQEGWENVIKAADMAIAKATNGIENANQIKKVIFSLPSDWVENDKIKAEHLSDLKKLSQDLDLTPLGFVVSTEAIIHYLQKLEGSPLTAILVGFTSKNISVTLIHAGKKEDPKEKERSESVAEDLKNILSSFSSIEIFPSRILLYDHAIDLEKIKQELLSYSWQKHPGFLHFPKIETLDRDIDLKSAVLAGITELGIVIEPKTPNEEKKLESPPVEKSTEVEDAFIEGDIREEAGKEIETKEKIEENPRTEGIKITPPPQNIVEIREEPKPKDPPRLTVNPVDIKNRFINFISKIIPSGKFFKLSILLIPIIIFILGGVLVASYWYVPKAKVTLIVESRLLEKNLNISISQNAKPVDENSNNIQALVVETDVSGQKATTATGKKTIGDKAKGEITIYNKTSNSKTFSKGAELTSSKNLKFTIDDEATIASSSAGLEGVTFGKTKVKITASQIGTDSNLNSGSDFSFKDYSSSSYSARNEQNLSGGTSREVTVIAKDDQSRLQDNLTTELLDKAEQDLKGKLSQGEVILEKGLKTTVTSAKFDKEVDSEAKDTTLDLSLHVRAYFYKDADIKSIAFNSLEKEVPEGYEMKKEDINLSINKVTFSKDDGTAEVVAKANLLPKIDTSKIKREIAGKYPNVLDGYFRSIPSVAGYQLDLKPNLPKSLATTPHLPQNIDIEIVAR